MENRAKLLIKDYYDVSMSEKIETLDDQINKNKILVDKMDKFLEKTTTIEKRNSELNEQLLNIVTKVDGVNKDLNNVGQTMESKLNQINDHLKILLRKVEEIDKKIEHNTKLCVEVSKEIGSVKSHIDTQMLNNNMEINRLVNSAIRTHQPIGFHASKMRV